jgi:hypothetical protein
VELEEETGILKFSMP